MITKTVNKINIENIKKSTRKVNDFIVDTADILVDETIDRAAGFQLVTDKAIKGGFELAEKQADIVFDVMDMIKRQWTKGQKNFKQRVNN